MLVPEKDRKFFAYLCYRIHQILKKGASSGSQITPRKRILIGKLRRSHIIKKFSEIFPILSQKNPGYASAFYPF